MNKADSITAARALLTGDNEADVGRLEWAGVATRTSRQERKGYLVRAGLRKVSCEMSDETTKYETDNIETIVEPIMRGERLQACNELNTSS